jgi:hypothetical protein
MSRAPAGSSAATEFTPRSRRLSANNYGHEQKSKKAHITLHIGRDLRARRRSALLDGRSHLETSPLLPNVIESDVCAHLERAAGAVSIATNSFRLPGTRARTPRRSHWRFERLQVFGQFQWCVGLFFHSAIRGFLVLTKNLSPCCWSSG